MKNLIRTFLLIIFLLSHMNYSQSAFSPSAYYTYGDYSTGNYSHDVSAYTSIKLSRKNDYFILGFDKLIIKNPVYEFDQKMFAGGIIKNVYPFYLKFNYAHINGDFSSNLINSSPNINNYTDKTNLFNGGLLYNFDLYFVGFTYTYLNLDGLKSVNSHQVETDLIWQVSPKFIFSVKPLYTYVTDGRRLFSVNVKFDLPVSHNVKFSADGSFGERAYYFNPDLLTIYNQDETQRTTLSFRGEFQLLKALKFIASYQYAEFNIFNINYIIGGIKFSL